MKYLNTIHWKTCCSALFVAAALMFNIQGCSEDNYNSTDGEEPRLMVNNGTSVLNLDNAAKDTLINFDCNLSWTITSSQGWCTVTPSQGRTNIRNMKVKISVIAHTGVDPRTAELNVVAGDLAFTLSVTQPGVAPTLNVVPNGSTLYDYDTKESAIAVAETPISFTINSNQPWQASIVDVGYSTDWITLTGGSVTEGSATTLTATVNANTDNFTERRVNIVIAGTKTQDTIKVVQAADVPYLLATPEDDHTELSYIGGIFSVNISSNIAWTVDVPAIEQSWFHWDENTSGTVTNFVVDPKADVGPRTVTVNFNAVDDAYSSENKSITFMQTGTDLIPSITANPSSISNVDAAGTTTMVSIVSNVDWEGVIPSSASSWLSFNGTSSTVTGSAGTTTVTVVITSNPSTADRSDVITFTTDDTPVDQATFGINQLGMIVGPTPTISMMNDSSARIELVGTSLDLVTAVTSDNGASNWTIKKQTATELWALAPTTIAAGTTASVMLHYSGGSSPATVTEKSTFMVTNYYPVKTTIYANKNGANCMFSTTEMSSFSVCDVDNSIVAKKAIDILLVSTTSDTKLSFTHPAHSTGTTNNFKCSATSTPVGGWDSSDKNYTALRLASKTTAAEFDAMNDMLNTTDGFTKNTVPTGNTADVGTYASGADSMKDIVFVFKTRMTAVAAGNETPDTRRGFIRIVKANLVTPYTDRDSSLDVFLKIERLAND
jgi:hypothetical protein